MNTLVDSVRQAAKDGTLTVNEAAEAQMQAVAMCAKAQQEWSGFTKEIFDLAQSSFIATWTPPAEMPRDFLDFLNNNSEQKNQHLKMRLTLLIGKEWEAGVVINFADFQEPQGNWLREAYAAYKPTENWKISVGRIFTAAGYTTPAPFMLETVNYPMADPFGTYGWGIGLEGDLGNGWLLRSSVTGNTGANFSDSLVFQQPEFSARLEKAFGESGVAATLQLSEEFARIGTDFTWKPVSQFYLRGEVAYIRNADERTSDSIGAYVFGAYQPAQWFEFHSQIDGTADIQKSYYEWQSSEADDGSVSIDRVKFLTSDEVNVVWTNGIRIFAGKSDALTVTADYEMSVYGTRPDRFLARVQLKF